MVLVGVFCTQECMNNASLSFKGRSAGSVGRGESGIIDPTDCVVATNSYDLFRRC